MLRLRRGMAGMAAALLALLMLNFASVQSTVMQAAAATPASMGPMCGHGDAMDASTPSMDGMQMPAPSGHKALQGAGHKADCPYCAAAATPPVIGQAPPLAVSSAVAFIAFQRHASRGPRGPPAREPNARGPPQDLTSA